MFRSAVWLSVFLTLCGMARGAKVCSLAFERCPGELASGTFTVPRDIVWIDARIPACSENIRVQSSGGAPSIVFVIDNSGSMSKGEEDNSSGGNDPDEARLRVVRDMLDTIARSAPSTEVGLVLFTRRLQFDDRDNPLFRRAFADTAQHDAFVPLTPLDKAFGAGVTGLDTLKALLKYTGNGNLVYATKYPDGRPSSHYDPPSIRDGTDISLGFEAAKAALRDAKADKKDQFIIFLSDGEPSDVDDPREALKNEFQKGRDVPTTFTVFFKGNSDNPKVPKTIQTMTDSIKANGYSATNPQSAYWAINQPGVQLDTLLRNRVLNPIIINAAGKAQQVALTVGGTAYRSASADANGFRFEKRIALTGEKTRVDLVYTYAYLDSGAARTKEVPYTLTLKRAAATDAPDALAAGLSSVCGEQGDIALYSEGTPVSVVTADHEELQVRLALGDGETCANCKVEVKAGQGGDRENVAMAAAGGWQQGDFRREIAPAPAPGDGKLEHLAADSIIATYVNPDNPLDVIRKAFPFRDVSTRVSLIPHNEYARAGATDASDPARQFVLVAPEGFSPATDLARNWSLIPELATARDSLRYVGGLIEASRAFRAEIAIFTTLGEFVNRIALSVPQAEFVKLPKGAKAGTRRLRVLWNNLARNGSPAGTGAFIMKTQVALSGLPGLAADEAESSGTRRIGVLREAK